jgi:hypothetical protein
MRRSKKFPRYRRPAGKSSQHLLIPADSICVISGNARAAIERAARYIEGILGLRRRGAIKQRAVPVPNHRGNHRNWYWSRSTGKDDRRSCRSYRSRRVHHHANRAMVGVRQGRMDMRHLDQRHQSEQEQAQNRGHAHGPWPARPHSSYASAAVHPSTRFYKNTQVRVAKLQFAVRK